MINSVFSLAHSDVNISRSAVMLNHTNKTTMSAGSLYPIYCEEVYPGDTFSIDISSLVRMSTPIHPVMDDAYLDVFFFSCPNRQSWEHWKQFMGEPNDDPYASQTQYSVPMLVHSLPSNDGGNALDTESYGIAPKSVADYMGVPSYTAPLALNALPFRHFGNIWNRWFRDQNLQNAIDVPTDDADRAYTTASDLHGKGDNYYITSACLGGQLPPVNKFHDYFTSCLLEPQKGDPVAIPMSGFAPVFSITDLNSLNIPLQQNEDGDLEKREVLAVNRLGDPLRGSAGWNGGGGLVGDSDTAGIDNKWGAYFNNLAVDLGLDSRKAVNSQLGMSELYATISDLRYAFQMQRLLEAENRFGTRYAEIIKGLFQVSAPDLELQDPEYLGGKRIHINMNQVIQTSSTDSTSPQGNTAAYSLTTDRTSMFTKSFTEHGFIIGVACIRTAHTYQQGLDRFWSRQDKFDYYFPQFAHISEQPVYTRELYIPKNPASIEQAQNLWDQIFGYQEAWAELRYKPNRTSGEFRSTYPQALDSWHYGDEYSSAPVLSDHWIRETRGNIDRTLAVSSSVADQFICDFYFNIKAVRPIPLYSVPGLADHF